MRSLAELRTDRHMTQRELAEELGMSSGAIGMYESGKRTPSLKTALMIARYFEAPVETISFSKHTSEGE